MEIRAIEKPDEFSLIKELELKRKKETVGLTAEEEVQLFHLQMRHLWNCEC